MSSIAIIYIERSYENRILQVSMDRIINAFGKRKTRESFLRSVHVLIILLHIAFNGLNCVLIRCKQHSVSFHILLRRNRVMAKKSLLDVVYIRFCLIA